MPRRGANEDRVVPQKKFMLLDPQIPIVEGNVPTAHQGNTINTFTEETLGKCRVAQVADKNGQGYYLEIEGGRFGQALVKYFENIKEIPRLLELYTGMGLLEEVLKEHRWTEECKNKEREITFANELDHPNIMKILGFVSPTGKMEDITAIVMEGATFGLLEQYATKEQLSDSTIKKYALQLAEALQYCHEEMQIIHRDVRPRNIYVHDNGNIIKLGNFGYARVDDKEHLTSNKGDEVYYRAPEMFSDLPVANYSFPVDVYSYGLVLWSISHRGEKPFYDNREQGMLLQSNKIFREYLERSNDNRPKIRPDLNSDLAELIRSCWTNLEMRPRPRMAEIVDYLKKVPLLGIGIHNYDEEKGMAVALQAVFAYFEAFPASRIQRLHLIAISSLVIGRLQRLANGKWVISIDSTTAKSAREWLEDRLVKDNATKKHYGLPQEDSATRSGRRKGVNDVAFCSRILSYYNAFGFASIQYSRVPAAAHGVQSIKLQGRQSGTSPSCALPFGKNDPVYGNVYLYDGQKAVDLRMNVYNQLNKDVVRILEDCMKRNNCWALYYRSLGEIINEEENKVPGNSNYVWPHERIPTGETWDAHPFLVNEVFKKKLDKLMELLNGKGVDRRTKKKKKGLFGRVKWLTYSIEFQERGPPHVHLLVSLKKKPKDVLQVDKLCQAVLPIDNLELRKLVEDFMIHTPCEGDPIAYCRAGLNPSKHQCFKEFPKCFNDTTKMGGRYYPELVRPCDGDHCAKNKKADNRYVVPYNTQLLTYWERHINLLQELLLLSSLSARRLTGSLKFHCLLKKTCIQPSITRESNEAEYIKKLDLIIWDEATMADRRIYECVHKLLATLRYGNDNKIFGGCPVILSGDWKQTLPVVPEAKGEAVVNYTALEWPWWKDIKIVHLHKNMRARDDPGYAEYCAKIGTGELNVNPTARSVDQLASLPLKRLVGSTKELITKLYGEAGSPDAKREIFRRSTILAVDNKTVFGLNDKILGLLDKEEHIFKSIDEYDPQHDLQHLDPETYNPHAFRLPKASAQRWNCGRSPKESECEQRPNEWNETDRRTNWSPYY